MLWIESVPSERYHHQKITANTTAQRIVVPMYGMWTSRCRKSEIPVPAIAIA